MTEETEFTWKIENFMLFPFRCYREIRSPRISAGNPRHSTWQLELCLQATVVKCSLSHRLILRYGQCSSEVSIVCRDGTTQTIPERYQNDGFIINSYFLPLGTLTLRCRITYTDVGPQYIADLTELSQKISSLYGSKEFSDLTLYTDDKEFFVHTFLLDCRARDFFRGLNVFQCSNERVKVTEISSAVLGAYLRYLYSGKLDALPKESLSEFYKVVEKYQFLEFGTKFLYLESPATISTQIEVDRKNISWNIDVSRSSTEEHPHFKYNVDFVYARFVVKTSLESDHGIWINSTIQCIYWEEDITMSCFTSFGRDENNLKHHPEKHLRFSKTGNMLEHQLQNRVYCKKEDIGDHLLLQIKFKVSRGRYTSSVKGETRVAREPSAVLRLDRLSHDLIRSVLRSSTGDVTLSFKFEDRLLFPHKAVLSVWSPVFSSMFQKMAVNSDEVRISDMNFETAERLLRFMYSGQQTKEEYAKDMELYVAADTYQVPSLFRKCSAFLASHLTVDIACDILVLAYKHNDESLTAAVQQFIASNRDAVLD